MPRTAPRDNATTDRQQHVVQVKDELIRKYAARKWQQEREWYRNILFYIGRQWMVYHETTRRWRRPNLPPWVPQPVTNRLASTANVIRSAVAQVDPAFRAAPSKDTEDSVLAAAAADDYLNVIKQESGFRAAKRRLAGWVVLTGNGFLLTEFDTSEDTGLVEMPGELCLDCGQSISPKDIRQDLACPTCGSKNLQEDPTATIKLPQGKISVRAVSPFEVYVDPGVQEMEAQSAVIIQEVRDLATVRDIWGDKAKDVAPDRSTDTGRYYLDSLAYMTATGAEYGTGIRPLEDGENGPVTLYRLYVKRHRDDPEGFYAVVTGDNHVLEDQAPYPDMFRFRANKKPFYPIEHVRYDDVPGRFWAKTPIDDLTFKQKQRNEHESLFQTITMRTANPVWLMPTNVQATPITGDPGIMVRYTAAGGSKPERLPGAEAPPSLIAFIQQIDADFEEIASTFAVMKGKNAGSVRAASAIQMLIERSMGRFGSVFDNLEEAYESWGIHALEIWRQKAVFPRVQAVTRAAGAWQFMKFLGADIGDVDIRVEAGSTRPKSQAGEQMLIQTLIQLGALNPQDPEVRMRIFEKLGANGLLGGQEDLKVIAEEDAKWMSWAQQMEAGYQQVEQQIQMAGDPVAQQMIGQAYTQQLIATMPIKIDPIFDNHALHALHHSRLGKSEMFRRFPEPIKAAFRTHVAEHLPFIFQEAQTGMGVQTLMGGTVGQAPPGRPGQNAPQKGQPGTGNGSGGASSPFGAEKRTGDTIGGASQKGTG